MLITNSGSAYSGSALTFVSVSLGPPGLGPMEKASSPGSTARMTNWLNGAALTMPPGPSVVTKAMGS